MTIAATTNPIPLIREAMTSKLETIPPTAPPYSCQLLISPLMPRASNSSINQA